MYDIQFPVCEIEIVSLKLDEYHYVQNQSCHEIEA